MFGYVRARREDLTVKNDIFYRAAYCGLCKEMGRCTGRCSRMTLSYDMVFLYLVRSCIRGNVPAVKKGRCLLHPFRSRMIVKSDEELKFAARASALLFYGKVCDDLSDERGFRRFVKKFVKPFAAHAKKKADLDELYQKIEARLNELSALEEQRLQSVDAPAEIFGNLLADVFEYGLDGDEARLAREIGFRTGRWIYAADAADDIEDDKKNGSYNPFLLLYDGEIDGEQKNGIEMAMKYDLSAAAAATDLIDDSDILKIVKNIIYLGMPDALHRAFEKKHFKEQHSEQESV